MESERKPYGAWMHSLTCLSMCVLCVVLPQRLDSVGCKSSAERALLARLAPLPRAEAPKASPAAPTSPEEAKQFMRLTVPANTGSLMKSIETCYWTL